METEAKASACRKACLLIQQKEDYEVIMPDVNFDSSF